MLTRLIRHPDEKIAERAVSLLTEIAPGDSAPAVPIILARLERERGDPSGPFHPLIKSLGEIGPAAKEAIPALRKKLQSSPPKPSHVDWGLDWLRLEVILALGRIGCGDPEVIDLLKSRLKGESWKDRAAAAEALKASSSTSIRA